VHYVYLLKCADERTYIGCTNDLKQRLARHQAGNVPATKARLPVELFAYFAFKSQQTAFKFEKYLKSGSGRAFTNKHLFSPE